MSKEKADRWPNTLVNLRLLREKARQDRIKKEEVLSLEDPIILLHDVHKFSKRNIELLLHQHCSVLDHHMLFMVGTRKTHEKMYNLVNLKFHSSLAMYCQMKPKDVICDVYNHNIVTPSNQPMFLHEYKRQYSMHCQLKREEKTHESV